MSYKLNTMVLYATSFSKLTAISAPTNVNYLVTSYWLFSFVSIGIFSQNTKRDDFPYERRPESKAYIPPGEGDYYYTAAVWGGYLEDMYKLVK